MTAALALWRDRRGRVSPLRITALALLCVPVVIAIYDFSTVGFGARPLNDVIHRTGYWALVFLLITLTVTPLRHVARWGQLIDVRRMLGVGAFLYAALHITLYVADQSFDVVKVAGEIVKRLYLTIGFVALLGLAVLAATSTDGMVRRLGGERWRRLHQASYLVALLALIHFFQQTKADVSVPTMVAGFFLWLMLYRLLAARWGRSSEISSGALIGLAMLAGALTLVGEAVGIGLMFGVSPLTVLQSAFDPEMDIRPGWLVLVAGLGVVIIDVTSARWRPAKRKRKGPPISESADAADTVSAVRVNAR